MIKSLPLLFTMFDKMQMIKEFFTDDQWDAISCALNDYQDYGIEEAEVADSIQDKIAQLFKN